MSEKYRKKARPLSGGACRELFLACIMRCDDTQTLSRRPARFCRGGKKIRHQKKFFDSTSKKKRGTRRPRLSSGDQSASAGEERNANRLGEGEKDLFCEGLGHFRRKREAAIPSRRKG